MTKSTGRKSEVKRWERIVYFFPVQLLFVHLKKNLILLLFWLILFGIILKAISLKYGIPYLFLQPEYLGKVNFLSHLVLGVSLGGFIMAFNLTSYVVNGFRFPFLATVHRPFIKYCQNNIIIPLTFSVLYIYSMITFQMEYEQIEFSQTIINAIGFVAGNLLFIIFTLSYFLITNISGQSFRSQKEEGVFNPVNDLFSNSRKWSSLPKTATKQWKVTTYIGNWGRVVLARESSHYKPETLEKVFAHNRINASLFQAGIILSLFVLGWFNDSRWMMIPASASILLFFTILIMIASAFYSWFKGWTSVVIVGLIFLLNLLSQQNTFDYGSQAYGLNYDTIQTTYTQANIRAFQENNDYYKADIKQSLKLLENWKDSTNDELPVAVFINVPGGGLRSALWTIMSLNEANDISKSKLWRNSVLISGSSGGVVGAAYLREFIYRRNYQDSVPPFGAIINDLSSDKLNPVAATAVLNDIFLKFKRFEYGEYHYRNDRSRAFEVQLNKDTRGWMNRTLNDYKKLEFEAKMPLMLMAPTISNDGRKLIIASQGVSYLAHNTAPNQINENIEFSRFFAAQGAKNLSFLSALRMSATFPYVFPATKLPSDPSIEILDAGIRDNYGFSNTLKFLYSFRNWLADNTQKIVIIQVRDQQKFIDLKSSKNRSLWESLTQPFGTFYTTILDVQDYAMEDQIRQAYEWYDGEIEVIEFILDRSETNPISLSWHLTQKEKDRIQSSLDSETNTKAFIRLHEILKSSQ